MTLSTYAFPTLQYVKDWLNETGSTNDTVLERLIEAACKRVEKYIGREIVSRDRVEWHDGNQRTLRLRHYPINHCIYLGWGRQVVMNVSSTTSTDLGATVSVSSTDPHIANRGLVLVRTDSAGTVTTTTLLFSTYKTVATLVAQVNLTTGFSAETIVDMPTKYLHRMGPADATDGTAAITGPSARNTTFRMDPNSGTITFPVQSFDEDWDEIEEEWGNHDQTVVVEYNAGYDTVPADLQQAVAEIVAAAYRARFRDANVNSESLGDYSYTSAVRDAADDLLDSLLGTGGWKEIR